MGNTAHVTLVGDELHAHLSDDTCFRGKRPAMASFS